MLRQWLVGAVLVAVASACAHRGPSTPSTGAQTTAEIVTEAVPTTVKEPLTTNAVTEPQNTTNGGKTTAEVATDAAPTTAKELPTTQSVPEPQPTTTKGQLFTEGKTTAETITEGAPTTVKELTTTNSVPEPQHTTTESQSSTKGNTTAEIITEVPLTTAKDLQTTSSVPEPQPVTTDGLPSTAGKTEPSPITEEPTTTSEDPTTVPLTTEPPRTCSTNGNIKGIFFLADGSGSFLSHWGKVRPFMKYFKEHVSRAIPVWFYQWSSYLEPLYCQEALDGSKRPISWGCFGAKDPCQKWSKINANCPTTQDVHLPAGWTDSEFENATDIVYTLNQNGWTDPWSYIYEISQKWKSEKAKMNLGEDDTALIVSLTDAQSAIPNATFISTIDEQKFKFVLVYVKGGYAGQEAHYQPFYKDPKNIITVTNIATQLNSDLAKNIVTTGCVTDAPPTTESKTEPQTTTTATMEPTTTSEDPTTVPLTTEPPRTCSTNGNIKGIFFLADGSGSFLSHWAKVRPFMKYFKEHVSRAIPVWFYQWSSYLEPLYCQEALDGSKRPISWGCFGAKDPCQKWSKINANCPTTQDVHLPAGWTDSEFENATDIVYTLNQNGWTDPWSYIYEISQKWKSEKAKMNLGEDDTALIVSLTDAQSAIPNATFISTIDEQKFKFVLVYVKGGYAGQEAHYQPFYKDPKNIITVTNIATQLNSDLAKNIVTTGCE